MGYGCGLRLASHPKARRAPSRGLIQRRPRPRWFGHALVVAIALLVWGAAWAQPRLRVVTTTSDLRSLVEAVGGEQVDAVHLAAPEADVENYQLRPRDLLRLRDAALVVRVGADFDLWFDALLARAGRAELQRGSALHVDASRAVALLEVRGASAGPGDGHAHGAGNPHYWLDPANAEIVTATLFEALVRIEPASAAYFEARRNAFVNRLRAKGQEWDAALAPLQGQPMVAHHNTWAYFARRFRLNFAGFIEPRPGVPPSPAHMARLRTLVRDRDVRIIVRQPHESARNAEFLAGAGPARVVVLAASVGALPQLSDYIDLIDHNVRNLAAAFGAPAR